MRFGSPSDRRKHETGVHPLKEMWVCEEKVAGKPEEQCGKVYGRPEAFERHLRQKHKIQDTSSIFGKLEDSRINQGCETRFWCGYCERIVKLNRRDSKCCQDERRDHIQSHLSGSGKSPQRKIEDWKDLDPAGSETDEPSRSETSRSDTPDSESSVNEHDHQDLGTGVSGNPAARHPETASDSREGTYDSDPGNSDDFDEEQLKVILNFSCHSIWGADIDSVTDSRRFFSRLILVTQDYVIKLTDAVVTHKGAASSDQNPHVSSGGGWSDGRFLDGPSGNGYSSNDLIGRGDGDGIGNSWNGDNGGPQAPEDRPKFPKEDTAAGDRLSCPYRVVYPRFFGVRTHYSCSMTHYPSVSRLKYPNPSPSEESN